MSDTNRRGEIVRDIYDNLTDDENNYDDVIAVHFTNYFQPWKKNNLRFYPIWNERRNNFYEI